MTIFRHSYEESLLDRIWHRLRDWCFATECTVHKDGSVTLRRGLRRTRLTSADALLILQLNDLKREIAQ